MKTKVVAEKRYTSRDVAEHFQVSKSTVLTWVNSDKLVAFKLPSGHLRYRKEEINNFARKFNMPELES